MHLRSLVGLTFDSGRKGLESLDLANSRLYQITTHALYHCFRLWEISKFVSKQLDKIGLTLSTTLVNAGLTSFEKLRGTSPRELELVST